jgi:hypothetical protein
MATRQTSRDLFYGSPMMWNTDVALRLRSWR